MIIEIDSALEKQKTIPVAFQAIWHADWDYLSLDFELVGNIGKYFFAKTLCNIKPVLNQGKGKHADEVLIAIKLGEYYSKKFLVPFYFPSPNNWDDDCPNWWEQEKGVNCLDCNKLVLPPNDSIHPKNVCYNCRLNRERIESFRKNDMISSGVNIFLCDGFDDESMIFSSTDINNLFVEFLKEKDYKLNQVELDVVCFELFEMQKLLLFIEEKTDDKYKSYIELNIPFSQRRFREVKTMKYKGKDLKLDWRFTQRDFYNLIRKYNLIKNAIEKNLNLKFYFKFGLEYRDEMILRTIKFPEEGKCSVDKILLEYGSMVDKDEILRTLYRLVGLNCITIDGSEINISAKGKAIL